MNTDWNAISSVAEVVTAVATLAAVVTAVVSISRYAGWARRSFHLTMQQRNDSDFFLSDHMKARRRLASEALLKGEFVPEIDEVLDFFEMVGVFVLKNYMDIELVWHSFHRHVVGYWYASHDRVQDVRNSDVTIWREYDALVRKLMRIEAKERHAKIDEISPSKDWIGRFLQAEVSVTST